MRTALFLVALTLSTPAFAQGFNVQWGGGGMAVQVRDPQATVTATAVGAAIPSESYRLVYDTNGDGATMMRIVSPEGARVQAWQGKRLIAEDDVPTSFNAQPDAFYRLVITLPDGRVWEKKLSARAGHTASLSLLVSAQVVVTEPMAVAVRPAGPMPMAEPDFAALVAAIRAESFENQRMNVLRTAAASAWFTIAQVGQLVDLFDFSNGKVGAVEAARPHILDPQNSFQLYSHFTFEGDKAKVRGILGR